MRIGGEGPPGRHPDEADLAAALGLDLAPGAGFGPAARKSVLAHLAGCRTCRRRARALRGARAGLQLLAQHDQDELSARRLERRVMEAWAAEEDRIPGASMTTPGESAVAPPVALEATASDVEPRSARGGPASSRSASPSARPWRRRVSAWAASAVIGAAATAAAAAAVERWSADRSPATHPAPAGVRPSAERAPGAPANPSGDSMAAPEPLASGRRAFPGTSARVRPAPATREPADRAVRTPPADHDARSPRPPADGERPPAPEAAARAGRAAREGRPERSSTAGETSVSILSQPSPYVRALTAAQRAHYERHDLEAALDHARRARRYAADRAQARRAERLECDALIASGRVEEAVVACERLLDDPNPERVRMTHYALGSLLRGRLGDCARALPHLDAAVVFGHSSLYGTDARLQRADCALARGDLEQVERDLRILRQREGLRDRSREIDDLAERLSRAMGATSATGRRGRAR